MYRLLNYVNLLLMQVGDRKLILSSILNGIVCGYIICDGIPWSLIPKLVLFPDPLNTHRRKGGSGDSSGVTRSYRWNAGKATPWGNCSTT